jgi:hypothetical protein
MRTTLDLPDPLFREIKILAATRGTTMKDFIIEAIEHAKNRPAASAPAPDKARRFPSFNLRSRKTLDLRDFDFDDLLA